MVYAQTPRDVLLDACIDKYTTQLGVNSSIARDQCNLDIDYFVKSCINNYLAFAKMDQASANNQCDLELEQMSKDIQTYLSKTPLGSQNDLGLTGPPPPITNSIE